MERPPKLLSLLLLATLLVACGDNINTPADDRGEPVTYSLKVPGYTGDDLNLTLNGETADDSFEAGSLKLDSNANLSIRLEVPEVGQLGEAPEWMPEDLNYDSDQYAFVDARSIRLQNGGSLNAEDASRANQPQSLAFAYAEEAGTISNGNPGWEADLPAGWSFLAIGNNNQVFVYKPSDLTWYYVPPSAAEPDEDDEQPGEDDEEPGDGEEPGDEEEPGDKDDDGGPGSGTRYYNLGYTNNIKETALQIEGSNGLITAFIETDGFALPVGEGELYDNGDFHLELDEQVTDPRVLSNELPFNISGEVVDQPEDAVFSLPILPYVDYNPTGRLIAWAEDAHGFHDARVMIFYSSHKVTLKLDDGYYYVIEPGWNFAPVTDHGEGEYIYGHPDQAFWDHVPTNSVRMYGQLSEDIGAGGELTARIYDYYDERHREDPSGIAFDESVILELPAEIADEHLGTLADHWLFPEHVSNPEVLVTVIDEIAVGDIGFLYPATSYEELELVLEMGGSTRIMYFSDDVQLKGPNVFDDGFVDDSVRYNLDMQEGWNFINLSVEFDGGEPVQVARTGSLEDLQWYFEPAVSPAGY